MVLTRLLPILLAVAGLSGGIGAGFLLRPDPVEVVKTNPCGEDPAGPDASTHEAPESAHAAHDYVKLNNQFVVPIVDQGRVVSLVVIALSLEVAVGHSELVYDREPKLRDAFLQVMFDHANAGGFEGEFTSSSRMEVLRNALLEIARRTLGPSVSDVLIMDFVRQDA